MKKLLGSVRTIGAALTMMAAIATLAPAQVSAISASSNAAVANSDTGIESPPADVPVSVSIAGEARFGLDIAIDAQETGVVITIAASDYGQDAIQGSTSTPPDAEAVEVTISGEAATFMATISIAKIEASEPTITAADTGQDARTAANDSIQPATIDQADKIASVTTNVSNNTDTAYNDTATSRDTQNSAIQGGGKGNGITPTNLVQGTGRAKMMVG